MTDYEYALVKQIKYLVKQCIELGHDSLSVSSAVYEQDKELFDKYFAVEKGFGWMCTGYCPCYNITELKEE